MIEVPAIHYQAMLPVLAAGPMRGHLAFVHAVLEGQPGQVYADDIQVPRTVLVCNASGFYFAFGRPDRQTIDAIMPTLIAGLPDAQTGLFATSAAWQAELNPLFAHSVRRTAFAFEPTSDRPPQNWRDRLPHGVTIEPLGEVEATRIATTDVGLDPWFIHIAGGPRELAAHKLGVYARVADTIASFCSFCALGDGEAELEVGTAPAFRGQGLATLTSAAFIEQCLTRGLRPAYSAGSGNAPSLALAAKLGFTVMEEIVGYPLERSFVRDDGVWGPALK